MRIKLKFAQQPLMFSNNKSNHNQFRNFGDKNIKANRPVLTMPSFYPAYQMSIGLNRQKRKANNSLCWKHYLGPCRSSSD
jgi:hypothetical protein